MTNQDLASFIVLYKQTRNTLEVVWEEKLLLGRPGAAFSPILVEYRMRFAPPSIEHLQYRAKLSSKINPHLCYTSSITISSFKKLQICFKFSRLSQNFDIYLLFFSFFIVSIAIRWFDGCTIFHKPNYRRIYPFSFSEEPLVEPCTWTLK